MLFAGGGAENTPTDDGDDVVVDDFEDVAADNGVLALKTVLPVELFDLGANVEVDANGEENGLSFVFVSVGGIIFIVAAAACDTAIGASIFLLSIVGAFGAGNDIVGSLMSVLFNFSCTLGKSTGSGGISCCSILPAFRCFEILLFRILLTCLLLLLVVVVVAGDL